jgi:hypothetical protein
MYNSEPATQPLSGLVFQLYLQKHDLSPLDVALRVGVRYMTIWRMMRALPFWYGGNLSTHRHQAKKSPSMML